MPGRKTDVKDAQCVNYNFKMYRNEGKLSI